MNLDKQCSWLNNLWRTIASSGSILGSTPNSKSLLEAVDGPSRGMNSSGIPAPRSAARMGEAATCSESNLLPGGTATKCLSTIREGTRIYKKKHTSCHCYSHSRQMFAGPSFHHLQPPQSHHQNIQRQWRHCSFSTSLQAWPWISHLLPALLTVNRRTQWSAGEGSCFLYASKQVVR